VCVNVLYTTIASSLRMLLNVKYPNCQLVV